jgi:hypothetical protein
MRPSLALESNADRVMTILSRFDVKNPRIFGTSDLEAAIVEARRKLRAYPAGVAARASCERRQPAKPKPAKPANIIAQVEASGTVPA